MDEEMSSAECVEMDVNTDDVDEFTAVTDDLHVHQDEELHVLQGAGDTETVCRVCGDSATGMYFGALVCVPCKVPAVSLSLYVFHCVCAWCCLS